MAINAFSALKSIDFSADISFGFAFAQKNISARPESLLLLVQMGAIVETDQGRGEAFRSNVDQQLADGAVAMAPLLIGGFVAAGQHGNDPCEGSTVGHRHDRPAGMVFRDRLDGLQSSLAKLGVTLTFGPRDVQAVSLDLILQLRKAASADRPAAPRQPTQR